MNQEQTVKKWGYEAMKSRLDTVDIIVDNLNITLMRVRGTRDVYAMPGCTTITFDEIMTRVASKQWKLRDD